MKTKAGSMANRQKVSTTETRSEEVADLHSLSELAGLHIPPQTMRVLIELLRNGTPPSTLYTVLRHIASASKSSKLSHSQSNRLSRGENSGHSSTSKPPN